MRVFNFFLLIFPILLLSCVTKSQEKIELLEILSEHKLRVPTILSNQYLGICSYNGSNQVYYYDSDSLNLNEINTITGNINTYYLNKYLSSNYLKINQLKDVCRIGQDSFFLLFEEEIVCINKDKIFQRKKINEYKNGKWPRHTIDGFDGVWKSLLDKNNQCILLKSISADIPYFNKKYFENEILVTYHYLSNKIEVKQVFFPDYYRKNYVGDMRTYSALALNDFVLISFSAINQGIKYCPNNIENINLAQSSLDQIDAEWLEWDKEHPLKTRRDNIIKNRIYDNLIFNNGFYYQFYRDKIALKDDNGNFNSILDKKLLLIKMDSNFKYLKEYYLPLDYSYNSYNAFVYENKLYINNSGKNAKNSDSLFYDVFDLHRL